MQRAFTNILCENIEQVTQFYEEFLGMERQGDFGWFVVLTHPELSGLEFGLLDRDHGTVPDELASSPQGVILTFVVNDVDDYFERAKTMGAQIIQQPTDMLYGQRRMLLKDPAGTTLDISSLVKA